MEQNIKVFIADSNPDFIQDLKKNGQLDSRKCCVSCGACRKVCPKNAVSIWKGCFAVVDTTACVGCGICKTKCDKGVIKIKQTMPMRKDLHEYFLKEVNMDLKVWDNEKIKFQFVGELVR